MTKPEDEEEQRTEDKSILICLSRLNETCLLSRVFSQCLVGEGVCFEKLHFCAKQVRAPTLASWMFRLPDIISHDFQATIDRRTRVSSLEDHHHIRNFTRGSGVNVVD